MRDLEETWIEIGSDKCANHDHSFAFCSRRCAGPHVGVRPQPSGARSQFCAFLVCVVSKCSACTRLPPVVLPQHFSLAASGRLPSARRAPHSSTRGHHSQHVRRRCACSSWSHVVSARPASFRGTRRRPQHRHLVAAAVATRRRGSDRRSRNCSNRRSFGGTWTNRSNRRGEPSGPGAGGSRAADSDTCWSFREGGDPNWTTEQFHLAKGTVWRTVFLGDLRSLVRFVSFWKKRAKSE